MCGLPNSHLSKPSTLQVEHIGTFDDNLTGGFDFFVYSKSPACEHLVDLNLNATYTHTSE